MEKGGSRSEPLLPPPPQHTYGVPSPFQDPHPTYVLVPVLRRRRGGGGGGACRCLSGLLSGSSLLVLAFILVLLASAIFFLWPSDPDLSIARLRLDGFHVTTSPSASVSVSIKLQIAVRNRDFFSLDYESLDVAVGYRGRRLAVLNSEGGHVRARGVSYIDAELRVDGAEVLGDAVYLIVDLARGSIPLETLTEVKGHLHIFFLDVPIKGRISCTVHVNANNQTIVRQDCYPE